MIVGFVDRLGGGGVEAGAVVSYKGFRFPAEVISHAVWLYHRFPLSFREVEELLLARGIVVSHETVRSWCDRFGPQYAAELRRRRPQAGDKWHLDEVFIHQGQRIAAVPVARGGPGRQRPRHPRPVPAQREGRQAVHGQTHEEAAPGAESAGHRQAPLLRAGPPGTDGLGGTPLTQGAQQPGREQPPAHPPARTRHERLPLTRRSTEVPRRLQPDLAPLPPPADTCSPPPNTGPR